MFISTVFTALCLSSLAQALAVPGTDIMQASAVNTSELYDAIVVGGGPAGLSATSGLARVRRKVLMIDSGEYRNNATRHMHDVIGLDGITGAYFRYSARQMISHYPSITMTNGTVEGIDFVNSTAGIPTFTAHVVLPSGETVEVKARSIVLAIGLKDDIPNTPGLEENWGKGIYWCPWCDGYEHADQALGLLAPMDSVPGLVREVQTQNTDVVAFLNGTDTPENRELTETAFPDWETYLKVNNVTTYNQTIVSITHVVDGLNPDQDPSFPTHPEYDLFRVDLDDGTSVERAAFLVEFPDYQRSTIGEDMGVSVVEGRLAGDVTKGYLTNIQLVYAVGDNNIDRSTNVPHAMYSGKRAAVYLHVALARLEATAEIATGKASGNGSLTAKGKRTIHEFSPRVELDPREVWIEMSEDTRGSVLDAGDFEQLR